MKHNIHNTMTTQNSKIQTDMLSRVQDFLSLFQPAHYVAPPQDNTYNIKDRNVTISPADLDAIRPVIYGEISNREPAKQSLEANVIMNTAINRMREYAANGQPKTLQEVISMPNQYQAYGGQQYKNYHNPPDPVALAKKQQVDSIVDSIGSQMKSGSYSDNTQGSYYYSHDNTGKITYDNTKPLFAPKTRTIQGLNSNTQ